jgi:hypothetical protein
MAQQIHVSGRLPRTSMSVRMQATILRGRQSSRTCRLQPTQAPQRKILKDVADHAAQAARQRALELYLWWKAILTEDGYENTVI